MITHLLGNIPSHVDVAFELIHPNFCNPEGISPHVRRQILCVRLMSALYMGNASTRQDLNTASTLPHLILNVERESCQSSSAKALKLQRFSTHLELLAYINKKWPVKQSKKFKG